jgi:hypothetical protein
MQITRQGPYALTLAMFSVLASGQKDQRANCSLAYENHNQVDYGPIGLRHVQGVVLDSSSVPIPQACLGLFTESDHNLILSTKSDEDGQFTLAIVPAGAYRLVARYDGFGVANIRLKIGGWPSGGFFKVAPLYIHMRPSGIDTTSYGDRRR